MQKYVNRVDLVKSFPTSIYLQKSASIQPRTSFSQFGGKFNSLFIRLLNLEPRRQIGHAAIAARQAGTSLFVFLLSSTRTPARASPGRTHLRAVPLRRRVGAPAAAPALPAPRPSARTETSESVGWQNFGRMLLVFGCIGTDFCK